VVVVAELVVLVVLVVLLESVAVQVVQAQTQ
jgi:hypothetical protein